MKRMEARVETVLGKFPLVRYARKKNSQEEKEETGRDKKKSEN